MLHYVAADLTALALAAGGLAGGLASFSLMLPGAQRLRSEEELNAALGVPLLAARPFSSALSRQLLEHWFPRSRVLPVVSAAGGAGRTRVAAELARGIARLGEPTLLIDADLRSPGLHRAFGLRNHAGLADLLEGRRVELKRGEDNLSVLVAGRAGADPLELLSRRMLCDFLAAAARRYRAILVDTPAVACGPDFQLFAAFGGGALVVAPHPASPRGLEALRGSLAACKARVVGTVFT
jgi:protein-tyrosine kinase